jgi:WD40 repeat protein
LITRLLLAITLLVVSGSAQTGSPVSSPPATGHSEKPFPSPDFILKDTKHKEEKSGVQLGPGGQLTIMQGVGTPTVINALSFSKDGTVLAAAKDFGRVAMWNVAERKFLRALDTSQGIVSAVALSPDARIVATGGRSDDFSLKVWDVATGKLLKTLKEDNGFIHTLRFDPKGVWLAVSDNAAKIYVLDATSFAPVFTLAGDYFAGFSQDGSSFVTANPKEFSVWSTADWSKKRTISWSRPIPTIVAIHSATDRMAVYQAWGVRLIRLSTGEAIEGLADILPKSSTGYPKFAEFSADGSFVYASVGDRLWVWDTRTNQSCGTPVMYSGSGGASADNHWMAGAKDDSIMSKERTDGVWLWSTSNLLAACGMKPPTPD